jgi:GrpB-like predicted nucleotidyltransferase (UPF0157 family)
VDVTDDAPEAKTDAARIDGRRPRLDGAVRLVPYDPAWPGAYDRQAARVRGALGGRVVMLEHVGSTSVPGLPAKPVIDMLLVVPDSADEPAYVPPLAAAGYRLVIREPDWHQHRLFKSPDANVNLHVFSPGSAEIARMLAFRDRLRADAGDRALYAATKRELAARTWAYVQDYADAKSGVVEAILGRATRPPRQGPAPS